MSRTEPSFRSEPGDELYFHSDIERQFRESDCTPGMASRFTEYFEEEI
jgi:hypothetical protein